MLNIKEWLCIIIFCYSFYMEINSFRLRSCEDKQTIADHLKLEKRGGIVHDYKVDAICTKELHKVSKKL